MKLVIPAILSLACLSAMANPPIADQDLRPPAHAQNLPHSTHNTCTTGNPPVCEGDNRLRAVPLPPRLDDIIAHGEAQRRPYTLITVTYGAAVGHSRGYATARMCEQAKSVATTGWTIEQNEEYDKAQELASAERARAWLEAHPPRKPTAKESATLMRVTKPGVAIISFSGKYIGADGLVHEQAPLDGIQWTVADAASEKPRDSIKFAQCVIETP